MPPLTPARPNLYHPAVAPTPCCVASRVGSHLTMLLAVVTSAPAAPASPRILTSSLPPACTDFPNPFGAAGAASAEDCTKGLSQATALLALMFGQADNAAAGVCQLPLSEALGQRLSGMAFVPPAGLSLADPFAAMCPEACSVHGVFAPGCAPPPPPALPPSPPQTPRPPLSPPPPPQPPQPPPQLPAPPTPQLPPCTDVVVDNDFALFNGNGCAKGLLQGAAILNLLLGSKLSEGDNSAMLCALPVNRFTLMAQAGGVEFKLPARLSFTDTFAVMCPEACGAHGAFAPGCAPPTPPPLLPPSPPPPTLLTPSPPPPKSLPPAHHSRAFLWGILPLFVLLVAALLLLYRRHARASRSEANLRISRDRSNLDLQMSVHVNEVMQRSFREELSGRSSSQKERAAQGREDDTASGRRTGQADDLDSLPDSIPTLRSTASLPPGPPSSSESSSTGAAIEFFLHRATSSAPTKKRRRAPPGSAAAPRAKKVYSTPYTVFCQEQRPLLPRSLLNSQREWTLGQMWKSLPDEEKAMYKPEDGNVRMATRCSIGLIPSPAAGPTSTAARYPSTALPLDTHIVAGAPLAVLPAAPSAAAPPQLQLTQTLQRMAEDDVLDLLL